MITLQENPKTTWSGKYKGISYEIVRWYPIYTPMPIWNSYIYLNLKQLEDYKDLIPTPTTDEKGRIWYDDHKLECLIDFHGGITYCSIENNVLKIGNDYNHYMDQDYYYNEHNVAFDLEQTINQLIENFPKLKYWCCGDGNYYYLEDGIIDDNNEFRSNEYWDKKKK